MLSLLRVTPGTAQHSTAQPIQPAQAAKQVCTDQIATTQASRQLVRASMSSRISFTAMCSQTNEEIEIGPAYKNIQPFTKLKQLSWYGVACTLLFCPSFLFRPCMRRPSCFRGPWSSWHLQVARLHLKPWTSKSASFIRILFNFCSRATVRRKRPEAPCIIQV